MARDFDYEQMLAGELYKASGIFPENRSINGQKIAQKINQLPIDETKKIVALEKELLVKRVNIFMSIHLFMSIMVVMWRLAKIFMQIWIASF